MRTGERGLFDSIAGQLAFLGFKVAANGNVICQVSVDSGDF